MTLNTAHALLLDDRLDRPRPHLRWLPRQPERRYGP